MPTSNAHRTLVLAPTVGDGTLSRSLLGEAGFTCHLCDGMEDLVRALEQGAGAILLTDDVLRDPALPALVETLRSQPSWSDIPILLLSSAGAESTATARALELLGNVTILERPVRMTTLVSALRTAVRARRRQYELRDQLAALERSEEKFRVALKNSPMTVSMVDRDLRYTWVHDQHAGMAPHRMIGRRASDLVPPEHAEPLEALERKVLETGTGARVELDIAVDGRRRVFDVTAEPLRNAAGAVIGVTVASMDVSQRKRSEVALRTQNQRLRLLWETAAVLLAHDEPDAMLRGLFANIAPHLALDAFFNFMVDESGGGLQLASYDGITREQARTMSRLEFGQSISGTVALQRQPIVATHIQQTDDPKAQTLKEMGIRTYVCNPLIADDQLLGTLSFGSRTRDHFEPDEIEFLETITQNVTIAYERLWLIRKLRETDRRKDEFLATLAHELRNPLAPIRNALQIMQLTDGQNDTRTARTMIERQLVQMVRLIDDLLDVGRITQGKLELRKECIEFASVVRNAVETARPLIEKSGHQFTLTLPREPVYVEADPVRLAQVFSNLLNNAAKYTAPGGHLWLIATQHDHEIEVIVRDTGRGIPAEALPTIFDMFTQAHRSLEQAQGGLGIGLTLVKRLVEMHGGRVTAHSEGIDRGTEIAVHLPIVVVAAPATRSGNGKRSQPRNAVASRILVADDNCDAAESMAMMLRMMGHEVRAVHDGEQAVAQAETFRPEVVLLDIGMPGRNGYEVARHLRAQPWAKDVTLVALTGWGQEEDKRRAAEAGFDGHFTKPVDPAHLEVLVAGRGRRGRLHHDPAA